MFENAKMREIKKFKKFIPLTPIKYRNCMFYADHPDATIFTDASTVGWGAVLVKGSSVHTWSVKTRRESKLL